MKFCNVCGNEIWTKDGENTCRSCEDLQDMDKKRALAARKRQRREREMLLRDCGLVKVRGAMGGVYWE
jgi:DNA-directed RNA polymerase subunit M/transcription elongation factor TFIIS